MLYKNQDCSSLTTVEIPSSVTSIGIAAFNECTDLTHITIPSSITSIGNSAFMHCSSLVYVSIPYSVTNIGDYAFYFCKSLTSLTIPSSVTSIGAYAFSGCSTLTSITIPSSVTSIGERAFEYCSKLTSITIPSSLTTIGYYAFAWCVCLTSITIPSSVTFIDDYAFEGVRDADVYVSWSSPEGIITKTNAFYNVSNLTLYVPEGGKKYYENKSPWNKFLEIKEYVPDGGGGKEKCAVPEIIYEKGDLSFRCATPDAKYYYTITCNDATPLTPSETGKVSLSSKYVVSAYAYADGYDNSEMVEKTIEIAGAEMQADMDGDGKITMSDANAIVNQYLGAE